MFFKKTATIEYLVLLLPKVRIDQTQRCLFGETLSQLEDCGGATQPHLFEEPLPGILPKSPLNCTNFGFQC